jgi:hypothetical protein
LKTQKHKYRSGSGTRYGDKVRERILRQTFDTEESITRAYESCMTGDIEMNISPQHNMLDNWEIETLIRENRWRLASNPPLQMIAPTGGFLPFSFYEARKLMRYTKK